MSDPAAPDLKQEIAHNLAVVRGRIDAAARAVGCNPADVTLIAVSKTQPIERIRAALEAGHRCFGENRVQEAQSRWPALRAEFPGIELHMIGHLQTNKAAEAVALFDVIQTVDRPKLARLLAQEMAKQSRRPRCFVEVNTGEEPQKGGVAPGAAEGLVRQCAAEFGLDVRGLMCIPPAEDNPAPHFALLADLAKRCGLAGVSMGMSADYEIAVRLGATHVRVGTAIFGARPGLQ
ncbi:MAG: YggS family pyridoxal phosphate-dependent enzyme [Alphaproteobacteria bacterium]